MGSEAVEAGAVATITRRAADRVRGGHLWVYRSDIERLTSAAADEIPGGGLLSVADNRGIALGSAIYSAQSEIALRMVSRQPGLSRAGYLADLSERILAAIELRERLVPLAFRGTGSVADNACRLIFSEADDLPGIVADRYNGLVVVQLLTQATARDDVRAVVTEVLARQPWVEIVVERPDARMRELEHLGPPPDAPLFMRKAQQAETALSAIFAINGLSFHYDAAAGQKTGAFLDQRLNYAAAASYARGRALDVCTYQGGFALHLAQTCDRVTGVDASRAALEVADRNFALNPALRAKVDWLEADAFELLRDFADRAAVDPGQCFDTVVLDPPAFAKSKRAAEGAMRGYKELNLRAMKMLGRGGTLITCSCSHHVATEDFLEVVRSAAIDAGRRVQMLECRGAAPDHPAILTLPETSYLKCLILRVG
ncbi:MAG TPA: class I SAM-dependent rRNA methyltransferase [Acidobacteriaceae bacterium]|nr:class I SAM-dependent rRNA methyltransferase [Acidobacteriaceae bacterium]